MAAAGLGEFERIERFFAPLAGQGGLGLRDDVALIEGPPGEDYVVTTDTIVESVHFMSDDQPGDVAQKLLRVNLSDLAAKGAVPVGYLLALSLPRRCDEAWLGRFAAGLGADQRRYGIDLLGGDSTATDGPISLTVTAIGKVPVGRAILRSGARPGDVVYVSGTLGDAALGLALRQGKYPELGSADRDFLLQRYRLPQPRLALGRRLIGLARAMLDVSDGLVADLGHLCTTSETGATIEAAKLPLSKAARAILAPHPEQLSAALSGGDDYELLFAADASTGSEIAVIATDLRLEITAIGRITEESGVRVVDEQGAPIAIAVGGYRHF